MYDDHVMALLRAALLGALLALLGVAHCSAAATTPAPSPTTPAPAPTSLLAVSVNPKKMSALVGERFIGLTMDPMDLSEHRKLGPGAVRAQAMARGLAPALLRLAGPSSDTLHFGTTAEGGPGTTPAAPTAPTASRNGTVTEADLLAVGAWTRSAGWDLVVALNALSRTDDGGWDDGEARQLLAAADHHGLPLALQLGYEAGALDRAGVSGSRLGADLSTARALLAEFPRYQDALLLGPDVAATLAASRAARDVAHFLQDEARAAASPPAAVVWQPWSDSSEGRDPVSDLDLVREDVNRLLGRASARRPLWIAESGGGSSRSFSGALQWAQRLQVATRVGADAILRQWRTPGEDHQPTPDYWVSLLHRRLCGRAVLDAKVSGNKTAASVTTQCTAVAPPSDAPDARLRGSFTKLSYERGDVTLVAVNPTAVDAKLAVKLSPAQQAIVHEYVLTAPGHDLGSRSVLLNDLPLAIDNGGVLPGLNPRVRHADRDAALELPAHSVAFFVFPGAQARACVTAPPSAVEAEAAEVPLHLSPATEDVHVQFHVEGLPPAPLASKSKPKDKMAAAFAEAYAKDAARKNQHRSEMHSANGRPLGWASVTDLEQLSDPVNVTPRTKRASPPPLHAPRAPAATPEDFMERLAKAQAAKMQAAQSAQAARRKHMLSYAPPHAAQAQQDELPDDQPSTIPAAHMYRPDDKEDAPSKPAHPAHAHRLALKPFKLPKRTPLVPVAPRHALPKRPAAPAPRFKPLPRTGAVVASLVDPERGVSAEDASVEVEDNKEDHFPTGEVLAEVGDSNEDAESSDKSNGEGLDYIEDDEDETSERVQDEAKSSAPQETHDSQEPSEQYYFAPGEYISSPKQSAAPGAPSRAYSDGEIGEMDMMVPAMDVELPSTPSPFEPHLEEFVVVPAPQRTAEQQQQDRARVEEDMTRLYQSVAEAAQDLQRERPPAEDEQDINTDVLIELGKKYLREKKMALKQDVQDQGVEDAPASAPSAPAAEQEEVDPRQTVRRKRQAVRWALPTGASTRPLPPQARPTSSRTGSAEDARRQMPRDLRKELEQRANERRERAEKARELRERESTPANAQRERPREQPDRERLSRTREQLEQQRQQRQQQREQQQREQQRGQPDRERLARAREQLEQQRGQQRQLREQTERERNARVQERRSGPAAPTGLASLRRAERVKRSDAPCEYLDSFGRRDALSHSHAGHAWHKVAPATPPRRQHARLDGAPSARFKYGHTPQRAHKNVHKDVHREVVKKTNVVRYLPAEEEDAEEQEKEVRRVEVSSEDAGNHLRRRQHQTYRPHDNLGTLWAGSPLSPLQQHQQHWVPARPAPAQLEETSYEAAAPDAAETTTEYSPDEVKTTEILKTERTYETPAADSWGADSGYSTETAGEDDVVDTSSESYAPLEPTPHHHHHTDHHHHGDAGRVSKGVHRHAYVSQYQDFIEQPEEQSDEQEQQAEQDQGASGEQSAEEAVIPPEAEGEAGPLPEFPFKHPPGPKSHVVGFTADDYSPGGWYTFSSGAAAPPKKQPALFTPPVQIPAAAPVTRVRQPPQPQVVPAVQAAYAFPSGARPRLSAQDQSPGVEATETYQPEYAAPPRTRPATIQAAYSTYSVARPAPRPRVRQDSAIEVAPPQGNWPAAPQPPRVEVAAAPWDEAPAAPAAPAEQAPASAASWSASSSQNIAAPEVPQPRYQPAPRPQFQPQLSVAVEEAPEYSPAPEQQVASYPAAPRRQPARQRKPQEGDVPQALAYLAKFFQPVEPVPVKKQSAPARDVWAQPAPADNPWRQPARTESAWSQSAWSQPAPVVDAWRQPAPAASPWNQPGASAWNQQAPTDLWGQPVAQQQAPQRRQSVQEASLASPGDQLLDYNKDILRYKSDVRSAAAPSLQFASLAAPGTEEPAPPRTARPASAPPSAPAPAPKPILAEWELPAHRVRRAAAEQDDALLRRRTVRGLFDGGKKVMTEVGDDHDRPATTAAAAAQRPQRPQDSCSMVEEVDDVAKPLDNMDRLLAWFNMSGPTPAASASSSSSDAKPKACLLQLLPQLLARGGGAGRTA